MTYETFRDMGLAYGVGLVLIYLLVVAQFRSYLLPLVIMAPIPLTVIGVMPGHALRRGPTPDSGGEHQPSVQRQAVHSALRRVRRERYAGGLSADKELAQKVEGIDVQADDLGNRVRV